MNDVLVFATVSLLTVGVWLAALFGVGSVLVAVAVPGLIPDARDLLRRQIAWAAIVGMSLAALFPIGQALLLEGRFGWPDPMLLRMVLEGPQGQRVALQLFGFFLLALSVAPWFGSAPAPRLGVSRSAGAAATWASDAAIAGRWRALVALVGAALVLFAFTRTGHTVRDPQVLLAALLFAHLALVAFWLAGLGALHRALANDPPDLASLQRFGRIAGVAVAGLVLAGVLLIVQLGGNPLRILESDWGRWLVVKLLLVSGLLGLAALNRWRLVPALAAVVGPAVGSPRSEQARRAAATNDLVRVRRSLARSIRVELLLFVLIAATTAVMIARPPPTV